MALLVALLCAAVLLAGCRTARPASTLPSPDPPWAYADLRLLDPVDAAEPGLDLVAGYLRPVGEEWQLRLDVLDLPPDADFSLIVLLDSRPGGSRELPLASGPGVEPGIEWEALFEISTHGGIRLLGPDLQPLPGLSVRLVRDAILDTLTLSFNRRALPGSPTARSPLRLEAYLIGEDGQPADRLGPLLSTAPPPPKARALIAFWNAFPAYTPREALRRWDGAHTGPLGGRHGLYHLLRAVRNTRTPAFLLDLKTPGSLAALDYSGGLALVRSLVRAGLLGLPDALPGLVDPGGEAVFLRTGDELAAYAAGSRRLGLEFGLPGSPLLFAPERRWPQTGPYRVAFIPGGAGSQGIGAAAIGRCGGVQTILLPGYPGSGVWNDQAGLDGPALYLRQELVALAVEGAPGQVLVLGGDLPATTWGVPQMARGTMKYLQAHPWIEVLGPGDLAALPGDGDCSLAASSPISNEGFGPVSPGLVSDPTLEPAAALTAWALASPTYPYHPDLPALRRNYFGQTALLSEAVEWARAPYAYTGCDWDPDGDGRPSCLLASESVFAVLEPEDSRLSALFLRREDGLHQVIGSSAQVTSGQSDPAAWDLSRGAQADPGVIPGAFAGPGRDYQVELEPGRAAFTAADGGVKAYTLLNDGIQLTYTQNAGAPVTIPLLLDPWRRTSPGWAGAYRMEHRDGGLVWGVYPPDGEPFTVSVTAPGEIRALTFLESRPFLERPEDPNLDYPPGHGVPFPMAILSAQADGDFTILVQMENLE